MCELQLQGYGMFLTRRGLLLVRLGLRHGVKAVERRAANLGRLGSRGGCRRTWQANAFHSWPKLDPCSWILLGEASEDRPGFRGVSWHDQSFDRLRVQIYEVRQVEVTRSD